MYSLVLSAIQASDSIVIFTHRNPDGDSYCSSMAMKNLILLNYPGKHVYVTGSGHPKFEVIYGKSDEVDDDTIAVSLGIILDCRDEERIEDPRWVMCDSTVLLDHHLGANDFPSECVVDANASSTCEMVTDFIKESDLVMSEKIANILFLGLCTDSGIFQFANDYVRLFNTGEYLVEMGAIPTFAYAVVNASEVRDLNFKAYLYTHYETSPNGVIYEVLDRETLSKYGYATNEASAFIPYLGNIRHYPVWIFFLENEDGTLRCEFRSQALEVEPIAASLGGGGHAHAAGLTLPLYDRESIDSIVATYDNLVLEWRANRQ